MKMLDSATSVQWNNQGNILACSSFGSHLHFFEASSIINSDLSPDACLAHIGHIEHKCPPLKPLYRLIAQFHPDPTIGFRVSSLTSNGNSINFYSSKTRKQLYQYNDIDLIEKNTNCHGISSFSNSLWPI
ncbi:hypothetical protein DSO57_1000515 [Entomophthora muscae]|uniref:Uncharacterized protein n=1 Tax=Entomophthora muscae TaxID=34485 RepID=A0ACC2RP50_9FUNG|nr:hypothetical protein DSO57_1000515 [Entomophthora muscae]